MKPGIVFHKDDQLMLVNLQKKAIKEFISRGIRTFPSFPVHCIFQGEWTDGLKAKELKSEICGVELEQPLARSGKILVPVKILMKNGEINLEHIILAKTETEAGAEAEADFSEGMEVVWGKAKKIRIFQLADIKKTGPVTEVWNPVWCKIR